MTTICNYLGGLKLYCCTLIFDLKELNCFETPKIKNHMYCFFLQLNS